MAPAKDAEAFHLVKYSANKKRRCDESKCLSTGLMPFRGTGEAKNPLLFNCYAQGPHSMYPYLCADDYIGIRISSEDVATSSLPDLHYYTCCPPDENDDAKVPPVRECGDPQEADPVNTNLNDWNPSAYCQANVLSYPYGRKTIEIPGYPIAYMCCNVDNSLSLDQSTTGVYLPDEIGGDIHTTLNNSTGIAVVIGEVEGVNNSSTTGITVVDPPGSSRVDQSDGEIEGYFVVDYSPTNEDYGSGSEQNGCNSFPCHSCVVENKFGDLQAMNCFSDVYQYPQVVNISGNTASYQCCTVPQGTDSLFVLASTAYIATVWIQFILSLIATLMASLLIFSVGRSLFLAKQNSSTNTTSRASSPNYSAYNLYLVLLAIPDLAYNLFMLGIVTENFLNGWIPENDALITISATTNQYMNAIIAREILVLLRRTKDSQSYVPPSFKRAGLQFVAVTAYATILGIVWLYLLHYSTSTSSEQTVRATVAIPQEEYSIPIYYFLVVIIPAIYLFWVCFEIWRKQLLPKGVVTVVPTSEARSNYSDTYDGEKAHLSLKNLLSMDTWNTLRGNKNTAATPVTDESRDNTNNTGSSKPADFLPNSTNEAALNPEETKSNGNSSHDSTPSTTSVIRRGRLNVLVMYFLRIILVFFFMWLPGMIMYYSTYRTDRNASRLPHNLALIFFSLQAIISNGIAFNKPDVKKAIHELWLEVFKICSFCCSFFQKQNEYDNYDASSPTGHVSSSKSPDQWPEGDIEVSIREEEPPERGSYSDTNSNPPSMDRIVTVHHEITNIGGVQVSQLTTHTISSFASDSNAGDDDGDKSIDSENNEHREFAIPSPRVARQSNVFMAETTAESFDDRNSKSDKTKKNDKESLEASASGSGLSFKRIKSLKGDPDPLTSPPSSSRKKKKKKILGGSNHRVSEPPIGPPRRRRNSGGHHKESVSPRGQTDKTASSTDKSPTGQPKHKRPNSSGSGESLKGSGSPMPRRGSSDRGSGSTSPMQRRGSGSHVPRRGSGSHISRRSSGSHVSRRGSGSHVQKPRGSGSHVPVSESPVAELRKKFSSIDKPASKSPVIVKTLSRRGSNGSSHLCRLNASGIDSSGMINTSLHRKSSESPVAQLRKKFSGDDKNNDNDKASSKSPIRPTRTRGGDNIPPQLGDSPVAQLRKKFSGNDIPYIPGMPKRKNNGTSSSHASKSPGQTRRRLSSSEKKIGESPGEIRRSISGGDKNVGESSGEIRRSLSGGDKNVGETPRQHRRSLSGSNESPGQARRRISTSDKNVGESSSGKPKRNNSGTTSSHNSRTPGLPRKRLSTSEKNVGEPLFGSRNRTSGSSGHLDRSSLGQSDDKRSGSDRNDCESPASQPKRRISSSLKSASTISDSSVPKVRKKRISSSKGVMYDGTVIDHHNSN